MERPGGAGQLPGGCALAPRFRWGSAGRQVPKLANAPRPSRRPGGVRMAADGRRPAVRGPPLSPARRPAVHPVSLRSLAVPKPSPPATICGAPHFPALLRWRGSSVPVVFNPRLANPVCRHRLPPSPRLNPLCRPAGQLGMAQRPFAGSPLAGMRGGMDFGQLGFRPGMMAPFFPGSPSAQMSLLSSPMG
jgi:hypothetical protein